jgi:hypothetical protein
MDKSRENLNSGAAVFVSYARLDGASLAFIEILPRSPQLGSCTSMTVAMYARRNGWPLERVTGRLRHSKIYASDCAECETKEGKIDRIERDIQFEGALTAEQRSMLREIANRCPVHRTLTSEIDIRTRDLTPVSTSVGGWMQRLILLRAAF